MHKSKIHPADVHFVVDPATHFGSKWLLQMKVITGNYGFYFTDSQDAGNWASPPG